MAKMIQVRNVPERLHRELVRRARKAGKTLTRYIQDVLERDVGRPAPEDIFDQIERAEPVDLGAPAAEIIRQERAEGAL